MKRSEVDINKVTPMMKQYLEIKDVGPILAQSMYDYFHNQNNLDLIAK